MKTQNLKNMKKWILSAAFVVAATLSAFANSAVIAQLKANAPAQIDCQFEQQKFLKGMAKPVVSKGALTYTKDNLSMIYTQPAGDYLHISPTEFSMQVKGKVRKHNIKPGSPMLVLKNTLTLCMDGDVEAVATENGATLTYANNGNHQFTLTKELNKGEKGYSKIVLEYNPKTYVLSSMTMVEANGNYTVYTLTNHK
jgi:outer membrane lipoprotein-sorting protein